MQLPVQESALIYSCSTTVELQETAVVHMKWSLQLTVLMEQPEVVFSCYDTVDSASLNFTNVMHNFMVNVCRQILSYFPLPDKLDCSQPQNLRSKNVDDTPLGKYSSTLDTVQQNRN